MDKRSLYERRHIAGRLLSVFCGLAVFFLLLGHIPVAHAAAHTLDYFQSYETTVDGRKAFRIEIGMTGDNLLYQVSARPSFHRQLIIDMADTHLGELKSSIPLDDRYAENISFQQASDTLRAVIQFDQDIADGSYQIHVEKRDRRLAKPYRLVINLFLSNQAGKSKVDGVSGHTILIDPGHGGSDTGAVGPDGVTEASVTLSVAKKVDDLLTSSGAHVVMTRDTDRDVSVPNASDAQELQARVDVGARAGADIFLSIHCNAFSHPSANGMETYYFAGSPEGERLAELLDEEMAAAGGLFNRGVKTANFYVLKHSSMPASLVELGFITNPHEEGLLSDDAYQETLAEAIVKAISRFFSEG